QESARTLPRKQVARRFANDLLTAHMKQLLESAVRHDIAALEILDLDHRRRVVQHSLQPHLAQAVLFFGLFTLDELPDLGAYGQEYVDHPRVRRLDFPAKQFDNAHTSPSSADRESASAVKPGFPGVGDTGAIRLDFQHVGKPGR